MSSARFEIEKRKLEYKIRQKERGALGGFGAAFFSALKGSTSSASSKASSVSSNTESLLAHSLPLQEKLSEGLKIAADQFLENPDKLDTVIKTVAILKDPKKSSLGTIVLGSLIGGILVGRYYFNKYESDIPESKKSEAVFSDQQTH